jgi:hypothetical protein
VFEKLENIELKKNMKNDDLGIKIIDFDKNRGLKKYKKSSNL